MRLIMMGPPGCGKGTQSLALSKHFNIPHFSTGDILREEQLKPTQEAQEIHNSLKNGDFVSDDIVDKLVLNRLETNSEFILDGYPRNTNQLKILQGIEITKVVFLNLHYSECINRLVGRAQGREDDQLSVCLHRIDIFKEKTLPVIKYYRDQGLLIEIDAEKSKKDVLDQILSKLN